MDIEDKNNVLQAMDTVIKLLRKFGHTMYARWPSVVQINYTGHFGVIIIFQYFCSDTKSLILEVFMIIVMITGRWNQSFAQALV